MKRYSLAIKHDKGSDLSTAETVANRHINGEYTLASDTLRLLDALKLAKRHIYLVEGEDLVYQHIKDIIHEIEGVDEDE